MPNFKEWMTMVSTIAMLKMVNGIFAVRSSDDVLDTKDWGIDIIRIDGGIIIEQTKVHKGVYAMPSMIGWVLDDLYNWLNEDYTGSHPTNIHEIKVVEMWD
jgi:hypothetical protein